ncbi:MAG: CPBP family intramembrane metalloprotease [Bacteroidales bacterium]|nr:CPBP family intramembrane metalloprotease [Bacteroidales bacterium]
MKNKTIFFSVLVLFLSWTAAALFYLLNGDLQTTAGFVFMTSYMFFPLISVVIVQAIHKEPILKGLGVSFKLNRWFVVAWLLPVVFNVAAMFASALFPPMRFSTETPLLQNALAQMSQSIPDIDAYKLLALTIVSGLSAGITINALFAFGEEIAWRGWLLKQFEGVTFLKASLIIGVFWGIWHAPLIAMGHNYAQHPFIGLGMMIVCCVLLTPVIQYIRVKSKSVISAAIFHGTLNAGAGLSLMYLDNFNDLLGGSAGLAGFLVLLVINCSLFAIDKWVTKENIFTKELSLE